MTKNTFLFSQLLFSVILLQAINASAENSAFEQANRCMDYASQERHPLSADIAAQGCFYQYLHQVTYQQCGALAGRLRYQHIRGPAFAACRLK